MAISDRDLSRLKELATLKTGDPLPEWLPLNDWGAALSELCDAAYREIVDRRQAEKSRLSPGDTLTINDVTRAKGWLSSREDKAND